MAVHLSRHLTNVADVSLSLSVLSAVENVVFCLIAVNLNEVVFDVAFLADAPRLLQIVNLFLEGANGRLFVHSLADHLVDAELLVEFASHHLSRLGINFTVGSLLSNCLFFLKLNF